MENCPRCSSPLERLSLADVTTVTCGHCGYADVPVEHEREFPELESWRDAFNRFYDITESTDEE